MNIGPAVIFLQGIFELSGFLGFVVGYFVGIKWLMIAGGIMVVLDDFIEIFMGVLNPLFPVLLAVVLAVIFTPWYVGVFWSSAGFKILGLRSSAIKIFNPSTLLEKGESGDPRK